MVSHETYWSTITDCNGAVEQELSYDAWGNLRDPNTWPTPPLKSLCSTEAIQATST